jgi:HSP20 family molecular chaperone IbpA
MPRIVASTLVIGLSETGCGVRQDGYPPYNVERLCPAGTQERLRITVAVAGFASGDLELRLEPGQ